jgi:hypothetical protein
MNPMVRYRAQNSPPIVRILCQINPTHSHPKPFLFKNSFNIIFAKLHGEISLDSAVETLT